MNSIYYFDIDDELFADIKNNFNESINSILEEMEKKNVYEGEMSLTVKVALSEQAVTDPNGDRKYILVPVIDHKATTKMTVKSEAKGRIKGFDGRDYLSLKKHKGRFVAVRIPRDASQLTLEDQRELAGLENGESYEL